MDMGIWISSQAPKLFSAILVIFHVGSPILTMAASYYNPLTDNSHLGGIICKYHYTELFSKMTLPQLFAQVGLKPRDYQFFSSELMS
jgi:hypothetical protein